MLRKPETISNTMPSSFAAACISRQPADVAKDFHELFELEQRKIRALEARIEWFLDDYQLGTETPDAQRQAIESERE